MPVWVAAVATVFVGVVCQGLTGFGFALIVVPLLSIAWDVKAAAVAAALLGCISFVPLLVQVRSQVRFRPVLVPLLGTVASTPAGVAMLLVMDADALKVWVAFAVITLSLLFALRPRLRPRSQTLKASLLVGMVSGLLGGSTGMAGAPMVLYHLGRGRDIEGFRSALIAYFLPAAALVLTGFAVAGRVTPEVLTLGAVSLPSLFLGLGLGANLRFRFQPHTFQAIVLGVLAFTSAAAVASVLVG